MSVITLIGYTPPARFDGIPWVGARIEESATEDGSFTEVETIPLTIISTDPRYPTAYGLTTELATEGNFYRVVWVASDAGESSPTAPEQFQEVPVDTPFATRAELARLLKVATPGASDDALDRALLAATGEILWEIGPDTPLNGWKLALVTQVNLDRAMEHWVQMKSPFGFVGLGGAEHSPQVIIARDSWERHAAKLESVKFEWGIG